jgi:hypothetical protein
MEQRVAHLEDGATGDAWPSRPELAPHKFEAGLMPNLDAQSQRPCRNLRPDRWILGGYRRFEGWS